MSFLTKFWKKKQESESSGVLFWFDWEKISEAGHSFYGNYIYKHILPLFAPSHSRYSLGLYFFFDGDCLPQGPLEIPMQDLEESLCLKAVKQRGVEYCYIVAVYGRGGVSFAEAHRELGHSGMIGYIGKTSCLGMNLKAFETLMRQTALPFAFSIQGTLFEKSSFAFIGDDQLRTWGFEPVDKEW